MSVSPVFNDMLSSNYTCASKNETRNGSIDLGALGRKLRFVEIVGVWTLLYMENATLYYTTTNNTTLITLIPNPTI